MTDLNDGDGREERSFEGRVARDVPLDDGWSGLALGLALGEQGDEDRSGLLAEAASRARVQDEIGKGGGGGHRPEF